MPTLDPSKGRTPDLDFLSVSLAHCDLACGPRCASYPRACKQEAWFLQRFLMAGVCPPSLVQPRLWSGKRLWWATTGGPPFQSVALLSTGGDQHKATCDARGFSVREEWHPGPPRHGSPWEGAAEGHEPALQLMLGGPPDVSHRRPGPGSASGPVFRGQSSGVGVERALRGVGMVSTQLCENLLDTLSCTRNKG